MLESWDPSGVVGRRVITVLGALYVGAGSSISFTPVATDWTLGIDFTIFTLLAGPGLVLLYVGYWLPRTEIRSELFSSVAKWCLGGMVAMLGILLFIYLVARNTPSVGGMLILTALGSLSGLGMGFNDAQAETRALNADEQRREAERYGKELERYETIVETVNDGIFVIDEDDYFIHVNEAYAEIVGYDREELLGSHTSLVVVRGLNDLSNELQHELLADDSDTKTYDAILETAAGEMLDIEATVAGLPKQTGSGQDLVGVVRDVTERNERERQLERQNQRLDSFASMVAHELRNPLMIGQMYCNELPDDAAPVAVDYITESFDRIDDIIDVLLVVTQGYETVPEST
ncbi:PAS domain S-box protein, partial [Haladaptatus sp. W1]